MCDGSIIKRGKWKNEKTPDLTQTFLFGAKDDINIKQRVKKANKFTAELNERISEDHRNDTPGFCFHNDTSRLSEGCAIGYRVKNKIGPKSSDDFSSYLRTYQVVYIMKCW